MYLKKITSDLDDHQRYIRYS